MGSGPLQILPPKPRMTLDAFRAVQKTVGKQITGSKEVFDAFQNVSARLGYGTSNMMEGTNYPFNRLTLNYILLTSLYRGNWIIKKIVDAIADDMTKNWLQITSETTPSRLKAFEKSVTDTGTVAKLNEGLKWGRLYGGAGGVIALKGDDNFAEPLRVEDVELDSYRGLLIFDRWSGISPSLGICGDLDDPLSFGLPEFYQISTTQGKNFKVHQSRMLRFSGPLLPRWEWEANMRWGASVVEAMFEELKKRDNTSWNIASLVFRANIFELKSKDLSQLLSGLGSSADAANRFYASISAMTQLMSNQGVVVTGEEGSMGTHQYSFGGINDVYQSFMLDICGATEYPMSRLFGRTVSGLGQGNEGDEHSYYDLVSQRQRTELDPNLRKLLPVIAMSTWGKIPKDFTWKYNPIRSLSNEEQADLSTKKSTAVQVVYDSGIIGRQTALKELKQQSDETGMFSNISDDDIEAADNEVVSPMDEFSAQQEQLALPSGEEVKDAAIVDADFRSSNKRLREITKEIEKLRKRDSALTDLMISQGRGNERPSDYRSKSDNLSRELVEVQNKLSDLRYEAERIYGPGWYPGHEIRKGNDSRAITDCDESAKLTHAEVKYEDPAKGKDTCARCVRYLANACQIVQSPIAPTGWCSEFKAAVKDAELDKDKFKNHVWYQGTCEACGVKSTNENYYKPCPSRPRSQAEYEMFAKLRKPKTAKDDALEAEGWEFQGLKVNIENLRGSVRTGPGWSVKMTAPYGYIVGTEGADGDEVDCFVGPVLNAPYAFVIHTQNPETREYDEDKVVLGVETAKEAQELFMENYSHPGYFESMERLPVGTLAEKLKSLRGRRISVR